jgi:Na+/H+ antiporter
MPDVELIIGLVLAAAVLAGLARVLTLPYPIVLVLGGLGLGFVPGLPEPRIDPDLVFLIFLPPLVYSAALQASTTDLRANARPIGLLATGLVLATMVAVAATAHAAAAMSWGSAFVLGAILGPTDPVAATAVLRRLGAPERLATILEGEALINDGTGLTVYKIAVAAVVSGSFAVGAGVVRFVLVAAGGVAIGFAAGWLSVEIRRRIDDPAIEASISLLTAFLAYLPADRAGASGILAAVTAGLYVGRSAGSALSPTSRLQTLAFWEVVAFLLDSVLFLLIGLEFPLILERVHMSSALVAIGRVLAVTGALAAVRLLWMFGVSGAIRVLVVRRHRVKVRLSRPERLVLGVTGMRGAVSLAAALAVPLAAGDGPFPDRDQLLFLTYTAILITLVVPGLALPWLLRTLGLAQDDGSGRRAEQSARLQLAHAALARLEVAAEDDDAPGAAIDELRARYEARIQRLEPELEEERGDGDQRATAETRARLRRTAIAAERERLEQLRRERKVSNETMRRVRHDLDLEESRLGPSRWPS